ncbi:hypothetical protein BC831DRAFT_451175 [Entophlyctis helioformis]|nr:hypothetical protein BC831DRAFT_451175 [Entophlyctis helioformis]
MSDAAVERRSDPPATNPTTTSYRPTATMTKSYSTLDQLVVPPVPLVATDGRFVFDTQVSLRLVSQWGSEIVFELQDTTGIKYFDIKESLSLKDKRTLIDIDGVPIANIRKSHGGYTVASGAKAEPLLFEIAASHEETDKHEFDATATFVNRSTNETVVLHVESERFGGGIYLGAKAAEGGAAIASIRIDPNAAKNRNHGRQIDIVVMPGIDVALVGLLLVAFEFELTKKGRPWWKIAMFMP